MHDMHSFKEKKSADWIFLRRDGYTGNRPSSAFAYVYRLAGLKTFPIIFLLHRDATGYNCKLLI